MRRVVMRGYGGPEVLEVEQAPIPAPGPGQVVIAAQAIGVGWAQAQMRRDDFPAAAWRPVLPAVPGGDVVGTVEAVGSGVADVKEGDRVGTFLVQGACAEYVLADAVTVVPVPSVLDAAKAAILPGTGPIAAGVLDVGALVAGESVLVHAAAGGVGHVAVQLAKAAGAAMVIATAHSPEKRGFAVSLGADVALDYGRPDWAARARALTAGRGVDLILNGVGGATLAADIGLLARGGRVVFYGSADGGREVPSVPALDLIDLKTVTGFHLSAWRAARPDRYRAALEDLTERLAAGRMRSAVWARVPLTEAARAHTLLEARRQRGRIVLIP
jgi:NADPH2:quinone reductase